MKSAIIHIIKDPEILAALIAATVVFVGYLYNAGRNRYIEKFKLKTKAYADFLEKYESVIPASPNDTLKNNDSIRQLNMAYSVLSIYSPASVVRKLSEIFKTGTVSRNEFLKIQSILHNDIHRSFPSCIFSKKIKDSDISYFTFINS